MFYTRCYVALIIMKASQLAEILLKNPDAIVMHEEYCGCDTPCLEIKSAKFHKAGKSFDNEGGDYIKGNRNGTPEKNIIVLYSNAT